MDRNWGVFSTGNISSLKVHVFPKVFENHLQHVLKIISRMCYENADAISCLGLTLRVI